MISELLIVGRDILFYGIARCRPVRGKGLARWSSEKHN